MRLTLDLQACQTESRKRGIGRYVNSLAHAILGLRGPEPGTIVALDGTYPEEADRVRAEFRDRLPAGNFTRYHYPRPLLPYGDPAAPNRQIASQMIARHHASLHPDAILCGSMFEGFVERAVTCENLADIPGTVAAAIIYDLIPLAFPDHYLDDEKKKTWYFRKLQAIKNCDLLLAISEATREDVIVRLGFPADRIVNISAAVDAAFRPAETSREVHDATLRRLGITRKYVLYTGNGDYRKNMPGAIEAFARLPAALRREYQLVLNQADRQRVFEEWLPRYGLKADEVVVTGYVDDALLVILFNYCDLVLFPSLYEGFGLPVLEAMACGAPVIGGDNSSIKELIDVPEARFDAGDTGAIAECMRRTLTDVDFCRTLREHGRRRAGTFSWDRSARLAMQAIEEATRRKRKTFQVSARRRRRLALFTPLPPERTGIASYSADLLPSLATHFVVDVYTTATDVSDANLSANFLIRPWHEFEMHAAKYDAIVYQIGNSPFHSYMFDMLAKYPGIVVLHDFFLSSVYWYIDRHGGRPGVFADELAYGHGSDALLDLAGPNGDEVCRQRYPCNRRVLERSIGVIAHSPGIHSMLAKYGMARLEKPVRVVHQLRTMPPEPSHAERALIRERLGFQSDDWLVCSFGFVADTKLSDRLVRALVASRLSAQSRVHLIFVGELDGGEYGSRLRELIAGSGLMSRIHITGFVDDDVYQDYLAAADLAVQLRTHSRGETSRAVLDCLAHGVPLIVNAHGTMNDYPETALMRLDEYVEPDSLAKALVSFFEDPELGRVLGAKGRAYIDKEHSPTRIGNDYAAAIEEMVQRHSYLSAAALAYDIEPSVAGHGFRSALIESASEELSRNLVTPLTSSLMIDLSEVVHVDYGTGIHRVVRNLTRELVALSGSGDFNCVPAFLDKGEYQVASGYARKHLGIERLASEGRIEFAPGDTLLLLDSAWSQPERFRSVLREAADRGTEIVGFVYDLIPLRHPDTCVPEMPMAFRQWLEHIVKASHAIVCISRATADDLIAFIAENHLQHRPGLRIHYAHLGSDLDGNISGEPEEASRVAFSDTNRPTFLMVGTIEPRKGHVEVLAAFERLWADGFDLALCLIGKPGWKMEPFIEQLRSHPEFGRRLHWLKRVDDVDLNYAYLHAAALVQASHAEGFGLPLLEAARHGTPVVCSDIPVFREVAGDEAWYFTMGSATSLAQLLQRFVEDPRMCARLPKRERTWRNVAEDLMGALGAGYAYRKLGRASAGLENTAIQDFAARITLLSSLGKLQVDTVVPITVELENIGRETWCARGNHPVRLAYRWVDAAGRPIEHVGLRTDLAQDLAPGECVQLRAGLRAPRQAARLHLIWTLVQEGVAWFDDRDRRSSARLDVTVIEGSACSRSGIGLAGESRQAGIGR